MTDAETIHQFAERNMLVEKYLLRELSGADLEDFEIHMFECAICLEAVKAGQVFAQHIAASPTRQSMWQRIKDFWMCWKGQRRC